MTDTVSKKTRSRIMAAVKSKNTTPELIVRRLVHALGFRYRLHVANLPGTPDLVFPCRRKIVNVCGCFWHSHSCGRCRIPSTRRDYWVQKLRRNAERDRRVLRELRAAGWRVLVVWECQTTAKQRNRLRGRLQRFLTTSTRD